MAESNGVEGDITGIHWFMMVERRPGRDWVFVVDMGGNRKSHRL